MIIALHAAGITFETVLGIWIFSKAFPERKVRGWKQTADGAILDLLILYIILLNFAKAMPMAEKVGIVVLVMGGILLFRCFIEGRNKISVEAETIVNTVIRCMEFVLIAGLLVWNYWEGGYVSTIMVVWGNVFLPFFLYFYYQCSWLQAYLWQLLYLSTTQIMKVAYMTYVWSGEHESVRTFSYRIRNTMGAVLFELGMCCVIFLVIKHFSAYAALGKALREHKLKFLLAAVLEFLLFSYLTDLWLVVLERADLVLIFTFTLAVIFILFLFIIHSYKRSLEVEKSLLDVRNEAIEKQYQELRRAYERNRCFVHDEKHMIQYMEECLKAGDVEAALQFVGNYKKNVQESAHRAWTGIPTLDFVIHTKEGEMDALSIDFAVDLQADEIPIEDADFVVLLGNLLDNAIEAAGKCAASNREIKLRIRTVNEMFLLEVENSSPACPVRKGERFVTTKEKREGHGWGIESVKHIVKKYGGEIDFVYDQSSFEARIMIGLQGGSGEVEARFR